MRIVVIVVFLDEERHLPELLASLEAQTRRPDHVYLVDDGSSDRSGELAAAFAAERPAVTFVRRQREAAPARDRLVAAGELQAFLDTLAHEVAEPYDVVAKMDGDLRLVPELVEILEREFERDPLLGLAGSFLSELDRRGVPVRVRIRPEHVHGATKFYRRECWEAISPLPAILGWDIFDEVLAVERGWTSRSFAMPSGDPLHLRPRGGHDGILRAHRRWGMCAWAGGHDPLFVLVYSLRETLHPPRVLGGLSHLAGYLEGAVRRLPRAGAEIRALTRRNQRRRLLRRATGRAT